MLEIFLFFSFETKIKIHASIPHSLKFSGQIFPREKLTLYILFPVVCNLQCFASKYSEWICSGTPSRNKGGSSTLRSINHLSQDFKSMLNYDFLIAALFYLSLSSTNKGAPEYGSLRRRKSTVEGAAAASYSIPLTLVLGTYTNFCSKQGMLHSSAFNVG